MKLDYGMKEKRKGTRGRPPGIPREGKYGYGKKTKVVRVPVEIADNVPEILEQFVKIKKVVDGWEAKVGEAATRSSKGVPSPRYEKAIAMLEDLRQYLG